MHFVDIIEKKKRKEELTDEEIEFWINGYVDGIIPDYQVSALLMAIVLNGMTDREISTLTRCMMNSGDVIDLSSIPGIKVDKHSTGGVGDKTSMSLMPMVASCGVKVAKMSGRGLGHTGGTLDKLESIPGFSISLSEEEFVNQVSDIGIALIGQTGNLVPADKKIYALRDVTGTVDSIPLIASSIMSKKLASGADVIVLDVKYGNGAFMPTMEKAEELSSQMIRIGHSFGKKVAACISSMDQPLGNAIGNALEVKEAIDTLKGKGPKDFTELCVVTGAVILEQAGVGTREECQAMMEESISSGRALEVLRQLIKAQGGDERVVDDTDLLPKARFITKLKSYKAGYVHDLPAKAIGILAMNLGAGRETMEDVVDPAVGIVLNKKVGDYVARGEELAFVYHNKPLERTWLQRFYEAVELVDEPFEPAPVIEKVI
ncbi:MAG: pyrimidine-nucleoside phosphorylase [Erysipelotrichaceae bacterium]|nr:pyrimidine-nucleoside phosphorylase [Erysipelotrichaceae bacterium]MBR2544726.1 pyrimidine-nucleoside phosphorylase [Erysipelotrichaceae bacterium]